MATIGIISCVSRKRQHSAAAGDLYDSSLFTKARAYVEARCGSWYILSAKYGLLRPDQIIEPYEQSLNTMSRSDREAWSEQVWGELCGIVQHRDHVTILAGKRYREFLIPKLEQHGCTIEVPMKGLGIGRQLQWLTEHTDRREG